MLTACPIYDRSEITLTMRHPRIWPSISDDGSPPRESFIAQQDPSHIYLGIFDEDDYLGLFLLHPHNAICWEVHTCLLPEAWGRKAIECAKLCIDWVFENTGCRRLITHVPSGNTLALRLAKAAGMIQFAVNPRSFLKDGQELDQIMLGISKGAPCQQQR